MNEREIEEVMAPFRAKRVGHRIGKGVRQELFHRLVTSRKEQVLGLVGPPGVGKTEVAKKVCELISQLYQKDMEADQSFIPFLFLTVETGMGSDFGWKNAFAQLLHEGHEPLIGMKRAFTPIMLDGQRISTTKGLLPDEFRRSFQSMVKHRRIKTIFLDEGSAIIDETVNKNVRRQFNMLKSLAVVNSVNVVLIGAYDLAGMQDANGQVLRRGNIVHMPRYHLDNTKTEGKSSDLDEFAAGCMTLLENLPITYDPAILQDIPYLLIRSVGGIGNFSEWADRATVRALLAGRNGLTLEDMDATAWSNTKIVKLTGEVMLGETLLEDGSEKDIARLYGLAGGIRGIDEDELPRRVTGLESKPPPRSKEEAATPKLSTGTRRGQRGPSRDLRGAMA